MTFRYIANDVFYILMQLQIPTSRHIPICFFLTSYKTHGHSFFSKLGSYKPLYGLSVNYGVIESFMGDAKVMRDFVHAGSHKTNITKQCVFGENVAKPLIEQHCPSVTYNNCIKIII